MPRFGLTLQSVLYDWQRRRAVSQPVSSATVPSTVERQMSPVTRDTVMTWLDCTRFPNHYQANKDWFVHISKNECFNAWQNLMTERGVCNVLEPHYVLATRRNDLWTLPLSLQKKRKKDVHHHHPLLKHAINPRIPSRRSPRCLDTI